jgi:hypothetical protein
VQTSRFGRLKFLAIYKNLVVNENMDEIGMAFNESHNSILAAIQLSLKGGLTPKGLRGVFSKKHSKTAVSSSRSPTEFFFIFLHF